MKKSGLSVLMFVVLTVSLSCSSFSTSIPSTFAPEQTLTPSFTDDDNTPTQTQDLAAQSTATSVSTSDAHPIPSLDSASAEIYNADMVLVPEGEFIMGNNFNNTSRNIYLDAYYIDKYEVSNALYKSCVEAGVCAVPHKEFSASLPSYYGYGNSEFDNYPVIYVDWFMAETFCEWRGAKLPTEAEWEKAARGTDGRTYPWGEDNTAYTHRIYFVGVSERDISPYGIYNMEGNAAEWVADWFSKTYYQDSPSKNPLGPDNGTERGVRGGAPFNQEPVPTFSRNRQPPSAANDNVGFRCARIP